MALQTITKFIADDAVTDAKIRLANNAYLKARNFANSANVSIAKINASDAIEFASTPYVGANLVQTAADKGIANGLATLDGSGKIPSSQLTVNALEYLGVYNATTNSPTLVDGTGNNGDLYNVTTAGTQNFGAGNITFAIGDKVVYNGTVWQKWDMTSPVDASELIYTQGNVAHWTLADNSTVTLTLDEAGSRIFALEGAPLAKTSKYEVFTLSGTDITNGYVSLAFTPVLDSIILHVDGMPGCAQKTTHYSMSGLNLTWAGALTPLLASGDVLVVHYMY